MDRLEKAFLVACAFAILLVGFFGVVIFLENAEYTEERESFCASKGLKYAPTESSCYKEFGNKITLYQIIEINGKLKLIEGVKNG